MQGSGAVAPSTRHRWWSVPLAVAGFAVLATIIAASFLSAGLFFHKRDCTRFEQVDGASVCVERGETETVDVALSPADARAVEPALSITGVPRYRSDGQVYFVTVRQSYMSLMDWFVVRGNKAARLGSYEDFNGRQTPSEAREAGYAMMRDAKAVATMLALERAGYPVEMRAGPPIVGSLCLAQDSSGACTFRAPAAEVLKPGDRFTRVEGTAVATLDDLSAIVRTHDAGDVIPVEVDRGGVLMTFDVELIASPDDESRVLLGFSPADTRQLQWCDDDGCSTEPPSSVRIEFDTNKIGGPSAGTAFTLALIDELTEGSLFGDGRVAVTGAIDIDGNVGAIGGLSSKTSAVKQVGVRYFIVPAAQGEADLARARAVGGDEVEIIPVSTLDEALDVLVRLGGDPITPVDTSALPTA